MFSATQVYQDVNRFVTETTRSAEFAELAGESTRSVYKARKGEIGRAIAALKRAHADLCTLETHSHDFDPETEYCSICGADGRA